MARPCWLDIHGVVPLLRKREITRMLQRWFTLQPSSLITENRHCNGCKQLLRLRKTVYCHRTAKELYTMTKRSITLAFVQISLKKMQILCMLLKALFTPKDLRQRVHTLPGGKNPLVQLLPRKTRASTQVFNVPCIKDPKRK